MNALRRSRLGDRFQAWEVPAVLFGLVLLSYGLWIPWMGLFGNDLPYLWYYHLLGPWGPGEFASIDRPFSAMFYAAITFLLGQTIWPYHVFLLALRWLSALLFWRVLLKVWPEYRGGVLMVAVLFAVYPGFRQNPVALEFILHFFVLCMFLLSLWATLQLASQPRRLWLLAIGSALGAAGLFWLEYFIGLELLRPIFLWLVTRRDGLKGRAQWKRILAAWLPSLVVVLAFLFWRVVIFSFPTYKPVLLEALRAHPASALIELAKTAARDLWTALGGAWLQTMHLPAAGRSLLVFLPLAAAAFALVIALFWRQREALARAAGGAQAGDMPVRRYWGEMALAIGLLAMLGGGSIFWLTGIPVTLDFPWDRSTLALMPGASLAAAGLLDMLAAPRYRPILVAALVAMAVGMHFTNAQEYRAEWQKLQDFTWQLTWRAPALKPGTLGLFDVIPLNRYSDNDLTALLNWTYAPQLHARQIPYKFFDLTLRLDSDHPGLPGLQKDLPVQINQRGTSFQGSTSSMIALTYDPPACLHILSPEDALLPNLPERISRVLPITTLEQVEAASSPARPPAQLGSEPAHGWCYYFQKADLARQQADWQAIVTLGAQASAVWLHPADPAELLPFIEGYLRAGKASDAQSLIADVQKSPDLLPALCAVLKRAGDSAVQRTSGCRP